MNVFAILSWYDEHPDHLRRCVTSLKGFADVLVALDGAYPTFPGARPESPSPQQWALSHATKQAGLRPYLATSGVCLTEVQKRADLFELAREAGATPADWLLIIDADMTLAEFTPDARAKLEATDLNVAEVRWHDIQVNEIPCSTMTFRSMFRALPGLTVERTHYLYTTPDPDHRFLWHIPNGHISPEPALDLTSSVTLHHYNSSRDPERRERAIEYYRERDRAGLEVAGDLT